MEKFKFSLPVTLFATAFIFCLAGYLLGAGKAVSLSTIGGKGVSPNILYLTAPVTSFTGKITKIEGSAVYVTQQFTLTSIPLPTPTPALKNVTYKIIVTANTQLTRSPISIPYLLTTIAPSPPQKLGLSDMRIGQTISLTGQSDLRTLAKDEFEAANISLPPVINSVSGKITQINDNSLVLKAILPLQSALPGPMGGPAAGVNIPVATPQEINYIVTVDSNTEISYQPPSSPPLPGEKMAEFKPVKPEKVSLQNLKTEMQITVYTDTDVTLTQKFTALRIEPSITPPPVSPAILLSPTSLPTAPKKAI